MLKEIGKDIGMKYKFITDHDRKSWEGKNTALCWCIHI